jgi:UDP-N-acetylglucosamine 2-epimerase
MKILSIVGARPQFVKAAMIADAVRLHNRSAHKNLHIQHRLVHTGQHYEHALSGIFFNQLPLPKPHYNLGVGSGSHGKQTAAVLERLEEVLIQERPDVTVVYGDTNSTIAGALAAAKLRLRVAHVEAGLRSFNRAMPEELNRIVTDHLSDLLCCPTATAADNLHKEGITANVVVSGDVMLDAVLRFRALALRRSQILPQLRLTAGGYVLATLHRAENTDSDEKLADVLNLLIRMKYRTILPMHPRTRDRLANSRHLRRLRRDLLRNPAVTAIEPVSYLDMLALESQARFVMTDSGGVQKEAYFVGIPCVTLRSETEWVETLAGGWNRLVDPGGSSTLDVLDGVWAKNGAAPLGNPNLSSFGNGKAAGATVQLLIQHFCG